MNRLAQQVRQLYYRRASLLYIKANPAQFVPFEETHLDSELKQLTQSIDDVTGAAEDWGIYLFPSCSLFWEQQRIHRAVGIRPKSDGADGKPTVQQTVILGRSRAARIPRARETRHRNATCRDCRLRVRFIAGFGVCLICVAPFIVFLCRALDSKIRALKKEKAWSASLELYISSLRTCLDDRASEIVVLTTAGLTAAIKAAQFDEQRAALRIRLVDLADRLQRVVEASWTLRRFQTLVELAASVKRLATGPRSKKLSRQTE